MQYDFVYHKEHSAQEDAQDVIKMECDPAYEGIQDGNSVVNNLSDLGFNDASVHPNLSHSSNLETLCIKPSGDEDEDQHGYVKTVQGADYLRLIGSATKSACNVATDINVANQCQS